MAQRNTIYPKVYTDISTDKATPYIQLTETSAPMALTEYAKGIATAPDNTALVGKPFDDNQPFIDVNKIPSFQRDNIIIKCNSLTRRIQIEEIVGLILLRVQSLIFEDGDSTKEVDNLLNVVVKLRKLITLYLSDYYRASKLIGRGFVNVHIVPTPPQPPVYDPSLPSFL